MLAGVAALAVGVVRAWGVNRGLRRRRAWRNRAGTAVGALLVVVFVAYPTLTTVGYLAKPRQSIRESALGLPHENVAFPAADGVRLSGWWVPGSNGAAVVVVHGGGGDRAGAVAHARMLSRAGYGVLLYDARGRGRSAGHENAFGWHWDRDVRGAVDFLTRRGIGDISLLGLSTGAEAVITEAAGDPRVDAVVADGVQVRTAADTSALPTGERRSVLPVVGLMGAEIRAVTGERPPPPLPGLVRRAASDRPLLMIATIPLERTLQRRYARDTGAQVWSCPAAATRAACATTRTSTRAGWCRCSRARADLRVAQALGDAVGERLPAVERLLVELGRVGPALLEAQLGRDRGLSRRDRATDPR